ncbi:MAG TPA: DUF952 domain-containing protein [Thermomicrobiales bacterium]|nr:DUF952 domain-containing protein [Thermomicrobiales bacterium]
MTVAYHLVAEAWYHSWPRSAPYVPEAFEREDFIHLTHGIDEALAAGNRYYRDDPRPYLLLTVDLDAMPAEVEVRYDDPDRQFPHIYGPLERAAIVGINSVERDDAGSFIAVATAAP